MRGKRSGKVGGRGKARTRNNTCMLHLAIHEERSSRERWKEKREEKREKRKEKGGEKREEEQERANGPPVPAHVRSILYSTIESML